MIERKTSTDVGAAVSRVFPRAGYGMRREPTRETSREGTLSPDPELMAVMLEELARAAATIEEAQRDIHDARLEHACARIMTATRGIRAALGIAG